MAFTNLDPGGPEYQARLHHRSQFDTSYSRSSIESDDSLIDALTEVYVRQLEKIKREEGKDNV